MTKLIFGSMSLTKCAPWVTLRGKIVDEPLGADGGEDQGYELMLMKRQECRGWVGVLIWYPPVLLCATVNHPVCAAGNGVAWHPFHV